MLVTKIAQMLEHDRGELFDGSYTILDIQEAVKLAASDPVQYIQFAWDNAQGEVTEFHTYTPPEWFGPPEHLLPNMQMAAVKGRPITHSELQHFILTKAQPEGAVIT